jgi:ABC-type phosphate transport system substrate-binding protein
MIMRNKYVAAAVAAALAVGASGVSLAAGPTPAQASGAAHKVYMAGSSAAAAGIVSFLETSVCGGANFSVFTTPTSVVNNPDFRAVSCTAATGQPFAGTVVTVWYRAEGGSVVGVLPVINNIQVKQLDIVNAGCSATDGVNYSCTAVTGTAPVNGTNDSWGPTGVISHNIDVGISDLEPGVFGSSATWAGGGLHDPFGTYAASFTGPDKTATQLQAMTHTTIFEQTFGFVVSTNLAFSDLPKEQIAAIFDGAVSDWSQVSLANNTAAGSGTITVCHREIGSGTRASTDVFLNGQGCVGAANTIGNSDAGNDNFQTSAELDCVNGAGGNAIGYVSVDNFSKLGLGKQFAATKSITVNGIQPSPTTSGLGSYSYVFEASLNRNASLSADATTLLATMQPALQNVNSTSTSAQISAIPGQPTTNVASTPLQVGTHGVLTSDFTRGGGAGNSCNGLTDVHQ